MNSESRLVIEIWDLVRDFIPTAKRTEVAASILRVYAESGCESSDLHDVVDEDSYLAKAFAEVFEEDLEKEINFNEDD